MSPAAAWPRRHTPRTLVSASLAAVAALTLLSGCEKPNPGATVFSGTHSANREAICWSTDAAQAVTGADCSLSLQAPEEQFDQELLERVAIIPTAAGQTVGISVDPAVAENGWVVTINGRALTREAISEKYFRFTMPPQPLRRGDAQLVIQALTSTGEGVRGAWLFGLSESAD